MVLIDTSDSGMEESKEVLRERKKGEGEKGGKSRFRNLRREMREAMIN